MKLAFTGADIIVIPAGIPRMFTLPPIHPECISNFQKASPA